MTKWYKTYTAYSVALFVAWGIFILFCWIKGGEGAVHVGPVTLVFYGFFLGWLSATIARAVFKS